MRKIHDSYMIIFTLTITFFAIVFFNFNSQAYGNIQNLVGQDLQCKSTKSFTVNANLNDPNLNVTKGHTRGAMFHYNITGATLESGDSQKIYIYDQFYKHHLYLKNDRDGIAVFEGNHNNGASNSSKVIEYNSDTNILTSITTRYNAKIHSFTLVKIIMECT